MYFPASLFLRRGSAVFTLARIHLVMLAGKLVIKAFLLSSEAASNTY
jgi:hypothetical protein